MCGRYTLRTPVSELQQEFSLVLPPPELVARYNIAPTQEVPIVLGGDERHLELARWGLVPFWAKDLKVGHKMINARAETLARRPAFRDSLVRKRCLIPADGFYEWRKSPRGTRTPFHIRRRSGKVLAFAGLWDTWKSPEGKRITSCTVITTDANPTVAKLHDRMPVILSPEAYGLWLSQDETEPEKLLTVLKPYEGDDLELVEASRRVNSPKDDVPECLVPQAELTPLEAWAKAHQP